MLRTRIKICGITREQDLRAAVDAGADALGFVFYPKSPRYIAPAQFAALAPALPPFVSGVGLFVNAAVEQVREAVDAGPIALLQFHGDETPDACAAIAAAVKRPFVRAFRVKPDTSAADLLESEAQYRAASPWFSGLLLDTWVDAYGGAGKVFDWSLIPKELAPRVVLSGGLSPFAVDISSGVEESKGIKDARKIAAFVDAVRAADASPDMSESHHERHPRE
jgi:phosphoribosylanthranilate isomerase